MALDIDTASAASLISAILEHSGYVTQSEILNDFKSFFRDAGALIYFIALVGGLVSLVVFGSFRASQYLIIGPALYWLLLGPQIEVQGVEHRFGKSEAMNQDLQQKVGDKTDYKTKGQVSVAYGFWLFAWPINETVNLLVENITSGLNQEDMLFLSKVEGLELIARSKPESSEFIEMLEQEIVRSCYSSFKIAFDASQNYIKQRLTVGISAGADIDMSRHQERFQTKVTSFKQEAENTSMPVSIMLTPRLHELIIGQRQGSRAADLFVNGQPVVQISCATAWNVLFDELWHHAERAETNKLIKSSGSNSRPDSFSLQCKELTRKIYDDEYENNECDIRPGIAMAMLWNHLSHDDFVGRIQRRHRTRSEALNVRQHKVDIGLVSTATGGVGKNLFSLDMNFNAMNRPYISSKVNAPGYREEGTVMQYTLAHGATHVEEVGLPIYQMVKARQFLYSFALNLPYYQGLLLYILSIAYPFFALVVLIPGKAANFLFLPLAWMWVKSWDVGFAAIFVLERVMYNILPNWSLSPNLRTKQAWTYDQFPEILGEGYNFSHIQAVSQHYTFLSMAMSAVPAIMGLMTVKGKKAILASFTDAVQRGAESSSSVAGSEYSITASNERAQVLAHLRGAAITSVMNQKGGLEGGLKAPVGMAYAAISAASKSPEILKSFDIKDSGGALARVKSLMNGSNKAAQAALSTYKDVVTTEALREASVVATWDPMIGRWGSLQMFSASYAAALDGSNNKFVGGFEISEYAVNSVDSQVGILNKKHDIILGAMGGIAETQGKALGDISIKGLNNFLKVVDDKDKPIVGIIDGILAGQAVSNMFANSKDSEAFSIPQKLFSSFLDQLYVDTGYSKDEFIQRFSSRPTHLMQDAAYSDLFRSMSETGGTGLANTIFSLQYLSHQAAGGYEGHLGHPMMSGFGGNRTLGTIVDGEFVPQEKSFVGEVFNQGISNQEATIKGIPGISIFFDMAGATPDATWQRMALVKEDIEKNQNPDLYQQAFEENHKRVFLQLKERLGIDTEVTPEPIELISMARRLHEVESNQFNNLTPLPSNLESLVDGSSVTLSQTDNVASMKVLSGAPNYALESISTWLEMTGEQKHAQSKLLERFDDVDKGNIILNSRDLVPKP